MKETKSVNIFTSTSAVEFELQNLQDTLILAKEMKLYLISKNCSDSPEAIEQAMHRKFQTAISKYLTDEGAKIGKLEQQFGAFITQDAYNRLNDKGEALREEFLREAPNPNYLMRNYYINMLDYSGEISIRPEFDKKHFESKHSINVDSIAAKHHKQLVESLNYFLELNTKSAPEWIFKNLVTFNQSERSYSLNLDIHDPENEVRNFVGKKQLESDLYSRYMK